MKVIDGYILAFLAKSFDLPLMDKIPWSLFWKFPLVVLSYKLIKIVIWLLKVSLIILLVYLVCLIIISL